MKPPVRRFVAVLAGACVVGLGSLALAGHPGQDRAPEAGRVDFNAQIRPLLSDRCFRCHGPDAAKRKAELRLDLREGVLKDLDDGWAVVKPHDPDRSELVRRIFSFLDDEMMPPPDSHLALSDAEKALLRQWVIEGAEYRAHWSLERVEAPDVPPVPDGGRVPNAIDAFVRVRLAQEGWQPAPRAEPETLIRRLAFNLTGLPPTLSEIDAFRADPSPAAYERAVEHYLSLPAYGERMALDWLDLARYADTYGYQNDADRDVSPYRDWVIRAFGDNLPYDQFLTWQLAGDLLPDATRDQRIATAFNRLHRQTNEGGSIEEEFRTEYVADRVNTFGTAVLGLTLECARCHDHKFDPITQRDYFSLFAFFNSIDESGLYSHFTNATPTPSLLLWPAHEERQHSRAVERIGAAEARLQAIAREAEPAFRAWLPTAKLVPPTPIAHLDFETVEGDSTPDRVLGTATRLQDAPRHVRGSEAGLDGGGALQFSGDNAVVHPGVREFGRTDAFSLALRLKPTERQDRAIVVHQSRAWTDAGSRGYELTLEDGRPFFGLIHFWPGNAIAVRARGPLPLGEWSRLVVTYDGSSRAEGIRMYRNGRLLVTDVVRDRLYKDINYDPEAGDRSSPTHPLTLGARFRDSGFKNGFIGDLQVFDTALTAAEAAGTLPGDAGDPAAFEHFLARHHPAYAAALEELARLRREENQLVARVPEIMVMEELPEPRPAHLLARGAYDTPGEIVPRDTPGSLPPFPRGAPRNRLGLARWVTGRENPLTARVLVNRIWRMHFGRGIVSSQEDFGSQGRLPTHPELLDWLAARFMDDGWDVKALHRLIVTSETFQQSSQAPLETVARDPHNAFLARGPRVRLLAEQIRDSALAASGLLTRTVGGPSVKPYQPAGLWEQAGTGKKYEQDTGDKLYRRSLYTFWRRTSPPPSMLAFDAMSREVCAVRGDPTTTPLQSLVLLNDPQFVESARALAEGLLKRFPYDGDARNRDAFRALVGRQPDGTESAILRQAFAEQQDLFTRDPSGATSLLALGESPRDESLPAADHAAMTAVVSLIMNFDEFVVVR
jgi:hypothetical protein